jgi:crotonobetaine/carnitine-CoA ligase
VDTGCNQAYLGDMLSYIIINSRATVMIVSARYVDRLADIDTGALRLAVVPDLDAGTGTGAPLPTVDGITVLDRHAFLDGAPSVRLPAPAAWDLACVTYTSGTTGPSKGVLVPWGQFHLSYRFCVYLSLRRRGRFVARDGFSGSAFWSDVHRYHATATGLTDLLHLHRDLRADRHRPVRGDRRPGRLRPGPGRLPGHRGAAGRRARPAGGSR